MGKLNLISVLAIDNWFSRRMTHRFARDGMFSYIIYPLRNKFAISDVSANGQVTNFRINGIIACEMINSVQGP